MKLDLEAIEKRCEAATEGPWRTKIEYFGIHSEPDRLDVLADGKDWGLVVAAPTDSDERGKANIKFIAKARQDIPALISEIRRLREGWEKAQKIVRAAAAGAYIDREEARKLLDTPQEGT